MAETKQRPRTFASPRPPAELRDWLHALGRRSRLLIVIPVVAAVAAGLIAAARPQQYRSTATVVLPEPAAIGPATAAVAQQVEDFEGAMVSDGIAAKVSSETGVPKSDIVRGISSEQQGTSSVVEVSFTGSDPENVATVPPAAAHEALASLSSADLNVAEAQQTKAQQAYDEANQAITELSQEMGVVDFPLAIAQLQRRLTRATDELNAALASGDQAAADVAQEKVDRILARAGTLRGRFEVLQDRLEAAQSAYSATRGHYLDLQGEYGAALSASIIASDPAPLSRSQFVARRVLAAGLFGLLLAVGLVILLEVVRPAPTARLRREVRAVRSDR